MTNSHILITFMVVLDFSPGGQSAVEKDCVAYTFGSFMVMYSEIKSPKDLLLGHQIQIMFIVSDLVNPPFFEPHGICK